MGPVRMCSTLRIKQRLDEFNTLIPINYLKSQFIESLECQCGTIAFSNREKRGPRSGFNSATINKVQMKAFHCLVVCKRLNIKFLTRLQILW